MLRDLVSWSADTLVLLGCVVMTIGVIGVIRMPDVFGKLHAASKSVFLGVCSLLVALIAMGDMALGARAALIMGLLLVTTPVAAYEMARAAAIDELRNGEPILEPNLRNGQHQG
ncbi:MAG: monovalent cation/H(+) antiporter subunit G [Thermomicrobiales bacterium]